MRNQTEVIYKTDRFSIFKNKNKTFSIEGVINKKRVRKRAKTMDEAKAFCHLKEEEVKNGLFSYINSAGRLISHDLVGPIVEGTSGPKGEKVFKENKASRALLV